MLASVGFATLAHAMQNHYDVSDDVVWQRLDRAEARQELAPTDRYSDGTNRHDALRDHTAEREKDVHVITAA